MRLLGIRIRYDNCHKSLGCIYLIPRGYVAYRDYFFDKARSFLHRFDYSIALCSSCKYIFFMFRTM